MVIKKLLLFIHKSLCKHSFMQCNDVIHTEYQYLTLSDVSFIQGAIEEQNRFCLIPIIPSPHAKPDVKKT